MEEQLKAMQREKQPCFSAIFKSSRPKFDADILRILNTKLKSS